MIIIIDFYGFMIAYQLFLVNIFIKNFSFYHTNCLADMVENVLVFTVFQALFAHSVEEKGVGIDSARYGFRQQFTGFTNQANRKIMNLSTALADQMVVLVCCVIKMFGAVSGREFNDFTKFYQKIQISVYGTETDIRNTFTHILIHRFCRRMRLCTM